MPKLLRYRDSRFDHRFALTMVDASERIDAAKPCTPDAPRDAVVEAGLADSDDAGARLSHGAMMAADLAEIPANVTGDLDIRRVKWIDEVLEIALVSSPQPRSVEPPSVETVPAGEGASGVLRH